MITSNSNNDDEARRLAVNSPQESTATDNISRLHRRIQRRTDHDDSGHKGKQVHLEPPAELARPPNSRASSAYMGSYSYSQSPRRSRLSLGGSAPGSPRLSISQSHLDDLLQETLHDQALEDIQTYGVEELRDGFFDSFFFKPPKTDREDLMKEAEYCLPAALQKIQPLSPKSFLLDQWEDMKGVVRQVTTTRAGIKLTKSFIAFFIAYILCLIPVVNNWLGRYNCIMALSSIINHPGRTVGAQIEGAVLTIIGTASGLGWGAFALWVSDSTATARKGYGGVLATFLLIFMTTIAALRSYYARLYQFVLCAGIAIIYAVLANTSEKIAWEKLKNFGIPWLFGQALCLLICCTVFPDANSRPLAVALHDAFTVMQQGLIIPQSNNIVTHQKLAWTFVNLSQAYRDLVLDISITRFRPLDVVELRNLMQSVIRSLLSLKMETELFQDFEQNRHDGSTSGSQTMGTGGDIQGVPQLANNSVINVDYRKRPSIKRTVTEERAVKLVANKLAKPTSELLSCMRAALASCDAALMDFSGYRVYIGPPKTVSSDILGALTDLRKAMTQYDGEEDSLLDNPSLPPSYSNYPEVVELFLFANPVRLGAASVEALLVKVMEMQQSLPAWRLYLPSYPFVKGLQRTNAQVRHDRAGLTAGFYFKSQRTLAKTMHGMANAYKPLPRQSNDLQTGKDPEPYGTRSESIGKYEEEEDIAMDPSSPASKRKRLRYKIWLILHRLQGFETRFALKVGIVTSLLSVPAWLNQSRGWWNDYQSWWAVVMVWIMMHPRIGGNFQDLVTRALCGVLGAVWGGLAYAAGKGNPYVMAVFAAAYMIPMIFRFTQSSHPRSGIVGCISFVVVSLGAYTIDGQPSITEIAWTRGLAVVVGVVSAVVVNWILWPFIARHELRKAISAMLIYSSIIYRGVVAKYVYYEKGQEPTPKDIERSEMLEGRLREGFVRIRQLMELTRHEIRLRAPFNPLPYAALIDSCERFFEYLVAVRQSVIHFHPHYMSDNEQAAESLLALRRDAVAAILMNLYVLAGGLRGNRKIPRYLPSAAVARKRLLDHMAELEVEQAQSGGDVQSVESKDGARKWSQIYSFSYSQSLTGCVEQLEQLQKYTKEIVGEQGFDPIDTMDDEDLT